MRQHGSGFWRLCLETRSQCVPQTDFDLKLEVGPLLQPLNAEITAQWLSCLIKYLVRLGALRRWKQVTLNDPEFKASLGCRTLNKNRIQHTLAAALL